MGVLTRLAEAELGTSRHRLVLRFMFAVAVATCSSCGCGGATGCSCVTDANGTNFCGKWNMATLSDGGSVPTFQDECF
jgi:hypothetical protein